MDSSKKMGIALFTKRPASVAAANTCMRVGGINFSTRKANQMRESVAAVNKVVRMTLWYRNLSIR